MPTVQEDILDTLFAKLSKSASIDRKTLDALRKTLTSGKKLKADDVVAILTKNSSDGGP